MGKCLNAQRVFCLPMKTSPCIVLRYVTHVQAPDVKQDQLMRTYQQWKCNFFEKDSLQNLGLCYQLGHSSAQCSCPQPGPVNFIISDLSGPHNVSINYCQCGEEPLPFWTQLLCEGWFLAIHSHPQTVFTFDCLETFHELTLQGKANLYDYYNTLLQRSDNANLSTSIVSTAVISSFLLN